MPVYFVVRVVVDDAEGYARYFEAGGEAPIEPHGGRVLAYDPEPESIEGGDWWDRARAVLLEFETEEGFRTWYESPAYQQALRHRLAATTSDAILVRQRPVRL